jgi:hypothetical protein
MPPISGHGAQALVKGADSARRVFAGAPEGSELALRAFTYFGGCVLYDARAELAQISTGDR